MPVDETADRREMSQCDTLPVGVRGYAGGPFFDCNELAKEAFGEVAEKPCLTHLSYLYRRFGPTFFGSDGYKDMCQYILTTSRPGLWFWVACKASSLSHCFGVFFSKELARDFPDTKQWDDGDENETVLECRRELVACFRELLRPVYVRDCPINLLGTYEADEYDQAAEPSRYAGYGCNREALEKLIASKS